MSQENETHNGSRRELISSLLNDNRKVRTTLREMADSHQFVVKDLHAQLQAVKDELARREADWETRQREYEELITELRARATTTSMSYIMAQATAEETQERLRMTRAETTQLKFERESALEGFGELEEVHDELEHERRRLEEEYETTAVRLLEMESEQAELEAELRNLRERLKQSELQTQEWLTRAKVAEAEQERLRASLLEAEQNP